MGGTKTHREGGRDLRCTFKAQIYFQMNPSFFSVCKADPADPFILDYIGDVAHTGGE